MNIVLFRCKFPVKCLELVQVPYISFVRATDPRIGDVSTMIYNFINKLFILKQCLLFYAFVECLKKGSKKYVLIIYIIVIQLCS